MPDGSGKHAKEKPADRTVGGFEFQKWSTRWFVKD